MVRRGGEPSVAKNAAREAATKKEYCDNFMGHYFKQCNKHSTQLGHQGVIDLNIIPIMGSRMKYKTWPR